MRGWGTLWLNVSLKIILKCKDSSLFYHDLIEVYVNSSTKLFLFSLHLLYSHSASIPISLHFRSRHSWHFLRMYMSISQFPPLLHLYTAFFVILLLKNPTRNNIWHYITTTSACKLLLKKFRNFRWNTWPPAGTLINTYFLSVRQDNKQTLLLYDLDNLSYTWCCNIVLLHA